MRFPIFSDPTATNSYQCGNPRGDDHKDLAAPNKPYNYYKKNLPISLTIDYTDSMETKKVILQLLKKKGRIKASEIQAELKITRQTVAQHFRELIEAKKVLKIGTTRNVSYIPYSVPKAALIQNHFSSTRIIKNLSEHKVFDEADLKMRLRKELSANAYNIANYTFTEMLNNAIDHSQSLKVELELICSKGIFEFKVIDHGIGIFEKIKKKFKLNDHYESVEHLLKGKQTTDSKRHSGEGIFFTSKIADTFNIESSNLILEIDNTKKDIFLAEKKNSQKGTTILFKLKQRSRKNLKDLFDQYSNENYEFDKTKVIVSIAKKQGNYVSRSEAKRILFGLDKFKRITFDFKNVKGIGQGFADEIFRVYHKAHPTIQMEAINTIPAVQLMIQRAQ